MQEKSFYILIKLVSVLKSNIGANWVKNFVFLVFQLGWFPNYLVAAT